MIKLELAKLGYKVQRKLLPNLLKMHSMQKEVKKHRYPTRNKNLPNIQPHMNSAHNASYMCKCITEFVILRGKYKQSANLKSLAKQYKKDY